MYRKKRMKEYYLRIILIIVSCNSNCRKTRTIRMEGIAAEQFIEL